MTRVLVAVLSLAACAVEAPTEPSCTFAVGLASVRVQGTCDGPSVVVITLRTADRGAEVGGTAVEVACSDGRFDVERAANYPGLEPSVELVGNEAASCRLVAP